MSAWGVLIKHLFISFAWTKDFISYTNLVNKNAQALVPHIIVVSGTNKAIKMQIEKLELQEENAPPAQIKVLKENFELESLSLNSKKASK